MNAATPKRPIFPLPVLLFSVGGVHYGVSADQVLATAAPDAPGDGGPLDFRREMGRTAEPAFATVIVRTAGGGRLTVPVDALEEIAAVDPGDIRPLPPLVASHARSRGVWGVIPRPGRLHLLIDFALWTQS